MFEKTFADHIITLYIAHLQQFRKNTLPAQKPKVFKTLKISNYPTFQMKCSAHHAPNIYIYMHIYIYIYRTGIIKNMHFLLLWSKLEEQWTSPTTMHYASGHCTWPLPIHFPVGWFPFLMQLSPCLITKLKLISKPSCVQQLWQSGKQPTIPQ